MKKLFPITAAWVLFGAWVVSPAAFAAVPMPLAAVSSHIVLAATQTQHVKAKQSHHRAKHTRHRGGKLTPVGKPAADAGNTSAGDTLPPVESSGASIIDNSGGAQ